jgi:hypothetical protein
MRGLNAAVQIPAANLVLTPEWARLQNLTLRFGASPTPTSARPAIAAEPGPLTMNGWLRVARGCETLEQCPIEFALESDAIDADAVNRLLNPDYAPRAWYQVFGPGSTASTLGRAQARGHLTVGRFSVRSLVATQVTADVQLQHGKLLLSEVRGDLLGGQQRSQWEADFTGPQPAYEGRGTVTGLAMAQLNGLMHDSWGEGVLSGEFTLALAGWSAPEMGTAASGSASFDWRKGVLRHIQLHPGEPHGELHPADLRASGPLEFQSFTGKLTLRNGTLTLADATMSSAAGSYKVGGTASLGRDLRVTLRNGGRSYTVSGPLDKPKVTESSEQATLRP